jgi:hypothetical protein
MKKRLLFLALWAVTLTGAQGQAWEQGVPSGSFINAKCAAFHPNYGLLFGGGKGKVWRVNNGVIDTLFSNPTIPFYYYVNTMAFSGDTLLFHSSTYGLQKMKIGDPATPFVIPDAGSTNCIVAKANKRWFAGTQGLFYYDGANYYHNSSFNSNIKYLAVNNSDVAFIVQNDSLMSVSNNQYTLISNAIDSINCLKVNPITDELYFSTPSQLYKLSGNSIIPIEVNTNVFNFNFYTNYGIKFFSFSSTEDRIFILYNHTINPEQNYDDILVTGFNNEFVLLNGPIEQDTVSRLVLPIFEANNHLIYTTSDHYYQLDNSVLNSDMLSYNVIDKGNFRALINSDGMLFWNRSSGIPLFEFPKFSHKNTGFSSTLWLAGINQNNDTCVAATRYNQVGFDFWAGPIGQAYDNTYDSKYNRVWKLDREQVNNHISNYQQAGYTMPAVISTWPAQGNVANGEAPYIAPFFDADNNGTYEPQNGDYPIVYGQQAAYFIFNDSRLPHTESGGTELGVEVHGMAYVMDSVNTDLKNTLFVKYNVFNRKNNDFANFYLGKFDDLDLGYSNDDYVGCDSSRSTFYVYNGLAVDGSGKFNEYAKAPPVQCVTFLNNDMTQFVFLNNSGGIAAMNDPTDPRGYFSNLEGFWGDRTPYTYGGDGYGAGTPVKFSFTGNPYTSTGWTETGEGNAPGDRRGLASAQLSNFNHGTNYCLDIAYVYDRDCDDTITCNNLSNIPNLFNRVDTVKNYFNTNQLSCTMNSNVFNVNTIPEFSTCAHAAAYLNNSQLNYSLSIDSVQVTGIAAVSATLVNVSWKIYQADNTITLSNIPFNVQNNIPVVLSLNLMHNPNTHTMNTQTLQYYSHGLVGIQEVSEEQISLYPNPAKANVKINGVENAMRVEVYNMLGELNSTFDKQGKSGTLTLDLSGFNRGVYFVKVVGKNGSSITKKLILN